VDGIDKSVLKVDYHTSECGKVMVTMEISKESMYSMDSSMNGNSMFNLDEDR
jgi:hypothetical protein